MAAFDATAIETILGHRFARPELIREALTHRSAAALRARRRGTSGHRRGAGSNERLEFLGDRVLGLAMAEWLAERYPHEQEGHLGRRHAHLVSQPVLSAIAERIGLAETLSLAAGEARAGVASRATVLADALEATLGALFLDGGLDAARAFIRRAWAQTIERQVEAPKDAKTALQEWALAQGFELPNYAVSESTGPAHAPSFTVKVNIGEMAGLGTGPSKRAAEQLAAEALLAEIGR